jgi:hypothetical protein
MRDRELFLSPFEDLFDSAEEDRGAKEERDMSNASLFGLLFLVAALPAVREIEIANASSAGVSSTSEEVEVESKSEASSAGGFLHKDLGLFLDFLFFSFSLLSLLDLESFGILSKITSPLVCVTSVLRR